jgi:hypothetical protein
VDGVAPHKALARTHARKAEPLLHETGARGEAGSAQADWEGYPPETSPSVRAPPGGARTTPTTTLARTRVRPKETR